jgi:hypothetical protein
MPTPDYIVLVLTVMAGLAVAGGAIVLTLKTPKLAAARAAFCIAAICIFLAGVIWGVTAEHPSMLARYVGAGLTAAMAAMGLVWIFTHLQETKQPEVSLFLECSVGTLPRTFPPSGRFYVSQILDLQVHPNGEEVPLSLGYHFGSPGAQAFPPESVQWATECKITNYGTAPVFNAVLFARVMFNEAHHPENQTTSWQSGPLKANKRGSITIAKIDAGKDSPFVFYLQSQSSDFVEVTFLPEVSLQEGADPVSRAGRLIIPTYTRVSFAPYEHPR